MSNDNEPTETKIIADTQEFPECNSARMHPIFDKLRLEKALIAQPCHLKILTVSPEIMLGVLTNRAMHDGRVAVIEASGLPEGVQVRDVCYDPQRHCFGFKLEHPSFEPIADGAVIPQMGPPLFSIVQVETRKQFRSEPPDSEGYWWIKRRDGYTEVKYFVLHKGVYGFWEDAEFCNITNGTYDQFSKVSPPQW